LQDQSGSTADDGDGLDRSGSSCSSRFDPLLSPLWQFLAVRNRPPEELTDVIRAAITSGMSDAPRPMIVTRLQLAGMHSVHSVRAAFTALSVVEGIARADVQLGRAVIEHDGRATVERLREALQLAGCEVTAATEERRRLPVL
jgi:copper chaperone CopZ